MRKNMNTMNYTRVTKNIYSYTRANGKKTYRVRKVVGAKTVSMTFHTLKAAKSWLLTPLVVRIPKNLKLAKLTLKRGF